MSTHPTAPTALDDWPGLGGRVPNQPLPGRRVLKDTRKSPPSIGQLILASPASIVSISVGAEKKVFHLHEKLLCGRIPYFEKALSGQEGKTITLPGECPTAFGLLASWLYGASPTLPTPATPPTSSDLDAHALTYAKLYHLTQLFAIEALQNDTLDHLFDFFRTHRATFHPTRALLSYITNNITPPSPIYAFFSLILAFHSSENNLSTLRAELHGTVIAEDSISELFAASDAASKKGMPILDPTLGRKCDYHTHSKTMRCSSGKILAELIAATGTVHSARVMGEALNLSW